MFHDTINASATLQTPAPVGGSFLTQTLLSTSRARLILHSTTTFTWVVYTDGMRQREEGGRRTFSHHGQHTQICVTVTKGLKDQALRPTLHPARA